MVARLVKHPVPRRVLALAALSLALLPFVASPATAGPSRPVTGSSVLGPTPESAVLNQKAARAYVAYEQARAAVQLIGEQSARLAENAELTDAEAQRLHDEVSAQTGGTLLGALARLVGDGESDVDRAAEAARNAEHARQLAATAQRALADAIHETERARLAWEDAQAEVARLEAAWTADEAARAAARRAEFRAGYSVDDKAQDARNRAALRRWHAYLFSLADAAVVPPAAKDLVDPDRLPAGLGLVRDIRDDAVPGVAEADRDDAPPVTVLPAETIRAVSAAFSRVGLPDVPGAIAPSAYACGGLLANAWGSTTTLPADSVDQWRELRSVPMTSLQVGDVLVLGNRRDGLEQSGVYLGHDEMIVADAETGTAAVKSVPRRAVYGAKRVNLPVPHEYDAPQAGACGVEPPTPVAVGDGPLVLPVASGVYSLSAGFGAVSALWSSGEHTGQDFAAPVGTAVFAAGDGVVSVEKPDWAGSLIRIDHGGGVETWYAHLSEVDVTSGQTVRKGQLIGEVGNEGNSTGPHLHFEVRLDGFSVDPALVLEIPERPRATYPNGEMPEAALCAATPSGVQALRCDAAVAFRLLSAAFADEHGAELCITDSYRSRDGQEEVFKTKPGLAATPGTSVHGHGLAVDLCGGVERFGTAEHVWMVTQGPAYGWIHPSWAAEGGSRPEAWHFEYGA